MSSGGDQGRTGGPRFCQVDPILFGGGDPNLYRYVFNDAVNRRDPSGLEVPIFLTDGANTYYPEDIAAMPGRSNNRNAFLGPRNPKTGGQTFRVTMKSYIAPVASTGLERDDDVQHGA